MKEKNKVASFFAGIGGICYGFEQAGAKIIWANEIDSKCCLTYKQNFRNTYLDEKDIKTVEPNEVPTVDIINGGFPCQAFSIAGNRKGFKDARGTLFFELVRIIKEKQPKAILLENVKNLLSHDNGKTFDTIKRTLEKIGYYVHFKVLNTMIYGNVPQNRERVYIVCFKSKNCFDAFNFPKPMKLSKSIADIIDFDKKVPDKYYYKKDSYLYNKLIKSVKSQNSIYQWRRVYCRENKNHVCPTLTANMGTGGHNVPIIRDNYGIRKLTPEECILFQGFPKQFKFPKELSNTAKYKQIGNSVSVPVIKRIAKNILEALKK